MSYYEACIILDMVKEGYAIPTRLINEALELTGDLQSLPNEREL